MAKKPLPTKHFVKMNHLRWRKERGIKIVVTIMPFKGTHRATCIFEGNTYLATGNTNAQALDRIMERVVKNGNLDPENSK